MPSDSNVILENHEVRLGATERAVTELREGLDKLVSEIARFRTWAIAVAVVLGGGDASAQVIKAITASG